MLRTTSRHLLMALFLAAPAFSAPVECLHNGEVVGTSDLASIETGLVTCQDPVTKIVIKETEFKNWMQVREKFYKDGALQRETSYDGVPGQNKYHGWKNTYADGLPVREELFEHGVSILQRVYYPNGALKLATAVLPKDKSEKSRVEFDQQGNLTAILCSKAIIGPKQKKWCGLDGNESTVTVFAKGQPQKNLTFIDGHLKIYEHLNQAEIASDTPSLNDATPSPQKRHQSENYSDGHKKFEKRFNFSGKLDGIQRYYTHDSEQPVIEDLYQDGRWLESRLFYPNGQTKLHFLWSKVDGDKRFGTYRSYFSDGNLQAKGECYEMVDKTWPVTFDALPTFLKHGPSLTWDEDGDLRESSTWKDGDRHGVTEYYFTRVGKNRLTRATYKSGISQAEQEFVEDARNWKSVSERRLTISTAPKRKQ